MPTSPGPQAAFRPTADCSVVLYGDSILHGGYGGSKQLAEPPAVTLKRLRPRYVVEDRTVNGETANARAVGFAAETRTSRFVVIAHGINDAARALPVEDALLRMVQAARAEGRTVILTGLSRQPIPVPRRDEYDSAIRTLAAHAGVAFADWRAVRFRGQDMADVLPPAKSYADRLVARIVTVLDELAPECRAGVDAVTPTVTVGSLS